MTYTQENFEKDAHFVSSMDEMVNMVKEAEKRMKAYAIANASSLSHGNVKVTFRKGSTRTSWDNKTLLEMMEEIPVLKEARVTSETRPSASIKVTYTAADVTKAVDQAIEDRAV